MVRDLVAAGGVWSVEDVARRFTGAKRAEVEDVLDGLAALGLLVARGAGEARRWMAAVRKAA